MADKWYIEIVKNSNYRKLLDYSASEIIDWVDKKFDDYSIQDDQDYLIDTMDNIIHEQEEFFGIDFCDFSKNQALTVAAKIIQLKSKEM